VFKRLQIEKFRHLKTTRNDAMLQTKINTWNKSYQDNECDESCSIKSVETVENICNERKNRTGSTSCVCVYIYIYIERERERERESTEWYSIVLHGSCWEFRSSSSPACKGKLEQQQDFRISHDSWRMTEDMSLKWIQHFKQYSSHSQENKVLLIVDRHSSHKYDDIQT
jgi:hypothetical protein